MDFTHLKRKFQQLHFELGGVYVASIQYDNAMATYEKVISLKPDSEISDLAQEELIKLKK